MVTDEHEYAVLGGFNRTRVGRYLFAASAALSSLIVFLLVTLVAMLKSIGWTQGLPPIVFSAVGAGTIYVVLYWLFSRHAWRLPAITRFLRVPNLAGKWRCKGQTLNPDKSPSYKWTGEVTIFQSWDKIRVRLKTAQSASNSVAAALHWDEIDGYTLLYHFRNEPNIDQPDLHAHHGFAQLNFARDRQTASGEYFNGHGRFSFGSMRLVREA
jgi:hypothetical protein